MSSIEKEVKWVVKNWDKIPAEFKQNIKPSNYDYETKEDIPYGANVAGLNEEGHEVVLLLDRQKPSVERSWDFDEERIGVNKEGQVIWGFDSGCSCPSPWDDSYPNCYDVDKEWKQFNLDHTKDFDERWEEECLATIAKIKEKVNG